VLGLGVSHLLKGIKTETLSFLGPEIMLLIVAFTYPSDKSKAVKVVLVGITIPLLFYVITDVMVVGAFSTEGVM
ncbi:GerAB/ArcD/ProY family transporter, partial [Bacillus paralicheniformis]|uniref:GerAB/ArcD/ProY family transporter n=1 Tax=Bacillus paralicheniformis TaxID=1648923 RepID=UPI0020C0DF13